VLVWAAAMVAQALELDSVSALVPEAAALASAQV